ncbi:hypothetical protein [Niallia sp. NCCP-28]|uniref:hypothetical protein n=1 Tax=Niallia sp. NCCP-28 TaxID=2934712 RepID=UPI00207DDA91|nr:hypothetical protein [Niallia sp. NCCP-28]GKU83118.1 hypothetical protein NCCP28_25140 [Niallia sp. NCCP-28]
MEWTLAILLVAAVILLMMSFAKGRQAAKTEQREIDMIHLTVMDEVEQLQKQIRNLELDLEIIEKNAGIQLSSKDRVMMREILDLYKRNYSIESIAGQKKLPVAELENMLSPYVTSKEERRKVAHEV